MKLNLRDLDNVAFQIETGFSNFSAPVDDLSVLDDYSITTDRNAFINLHMQTSTSSPNIAHIRIFTTPSTVMGNVSITSVGYLRLLDTVRIWLNKNTSNVDSDLDDIINDMLDSFRKYHRYDNTS